MLDDEQEFVMRLRHGRLGAQHGAKLLGVLERAEGRFSAAIERLEESQDLAVESGDLLLNAEIMRELGDTWQELGDSERAAGHWQQAGGYFRELGAVVDAVEIESRMSAA